MLCPKCGFISFDHFSVCVKCQNDLSQIGAILQGTATDAVCQHFLGLAHRDDSTTQDDYSEDETTSTTLTMPFANEAIAENTDQTKIDLAGDLDEEASLAFPEDDSPGLEFDLDEIPQLDLSGFESVAENKESATPAKIAKENEAPQQPTIAETSLPDNKPAINDGPLEIDTFNLSMDSEKSPIEGLEDSEEAAVVDSQPSATNESSEQLAIDLDEIDLSDLIHQENQVSSAAANASDDDEKEESLDFEDTMDLSLFASAGNDSTESPAFSFTDTGLEPIDLTLMDEALVELSVDPTRKEASFQKEAPADELELSMEDTSK